MLSFLDQRTESQKAYEKACEDFREQHASGWEVYVDGKLVCELEHLERPTRQGDFRVVNPRASREIIEYTLRSVERGPNDSISYRCRGDKHVVVEDKYFVGFIEGDIVRFRDFRGSTIE